MILDIFSKTTNLILLLILFVLGQVYLFIIFNFIILHYKNKPDEDIGNTKHKYKRHHRVHSYRLIACWYRWKLVEAFINCWHKIFGI